MRSAEAHELLAARDPDLPGLSAVLDDEVLSRRLGAPSTRTYVRYKTGTSAIALVDIDGRSAIAVAGPAGEGPKRAKALKHTVPADVLLDEPDDGLLVLDAMTDRRLPALRHLVRPGKVGLWLAGRGHPVDVDAPPRTLAHKPGRRWVGSLPMTGEDGHVVLRAYTSEGFDSALAAHGLLDPTKCTSVRLPRVLHTHRRGLIALEHLPGATLDTTVDAASLRRLGAGLGELHASGPTDLPTAEGPPPATHGLDILAPVLRPSVDAATAVHAAASAALRPAPGSVVHGDLSLDQVVAEGEGLGIIDLDRVRIGTPLDDVASLLAEAALTALPTGGTSAAVALMDRLRDPLLDGHASTWTGPVGQDLGARTALAMLTRADEPFRSGCPTWPETTEEIVALAASLARGTVAA